MTHTLNRTEGVTLKLSNLGLQILCLFLKLEKKESQALHSFKSSGTRPFRRRRLLTTLVQRSLFLSLLFLFSSLCLSLSLSLVARRTGLFSDRSLSFQVLSTLQKSIITTCTRTLCITSITKATKAKTDIWWCVERTFCFKRVRE